MKFIRFLGGSGRLTKIRATTRPQSVWPEVWTKIGNPAQKRKKPEWAIEKPKVDNARKLRGIYVIDPEDGDFNETLKNARRKLEVPMDAECRARKEQRNPTRFRKPKRRVVNPTRFQKQKHACIVEARESTRKRLELELKRLNAKEVIFPKQGEFIFPVADGRIKLPGGD